MVEAGKFQSGSLIALPIFPRLPGPVVASPLTNPIVPCLPSSLLSFPTARLTVV